MSKPKTGGSADVRSGSPGDLGSRRGIAAACIGNATEWYDFAIFGSLATVIGLVFFPSGNLTTALTAGFAAYGTALLVRPLGAILIGRLGDQRGRRSVLVLVIFLMAGATAAVAVLPGYATIGLLAPIGLMLLRAVQGLAAGGELGVAAVFILESAPDSRRGWAGGLHIATMALGIATGMAVAVTLFVFFGDDDLDSGWWRIAFLLALPLGLIGAYLRRRVAETTHFQEVDAGSAIVDRPVRLLWKQHRAALTRGFCLIAAGSLAFNIFFIFMPNNLAARHGASLAPTLAGTAVALGVAAAAAVVLGRLSDRIGRRPVTITSTAALVVLAIPMSLVATRGSLLALLLAQLTVGVVVAGVLSMAMVGELFHSTLRSTGLGLTVGLATAVVGGTAPWLSQIMVVKLDAQALPGCYVALVALLALIALRKWPESAFAGLS
ncbi:MAG: MFS transporter [Microlunatus sp.]|nr:MFS transporter [Microlunatus sp.]